VWPASVHSGYKNVLSTQVRGPSIFIRFSPGPRGSQQLCACQDSLECDMIVAPRHFVGDKELLRPIPIACHLIEDLDDQ
jgi:hypothetical protein